MVQPINAYRLDFRPPTAILKNGFNGSNNDWMNQVYGNNTVYCAKSLRGVSRFFLESVLNEKADGSKQKGPLSDNMGTIYKQPDYVYVYMINVTGLEFIDVANDLTPLTPLSYKGVNPNSKLLKFQEDKKLARGELDFDEDYWNTKLYYYLQDCATHTQKS